MSLYNNEISKSKFLLSGQVILGGYDGRPLASVELFPPPSSTHCSIPALPRPRAGLSLSLLPEGRLVVCGGFDDQGNHLHSCLAWVDGMNSWTQIFTMRWLQVLICIFKHTVNRTSPLIIKGWRGSGTLPGRHRHIRVPLCSLVGEPVQPMQRLLEGPQVSNLFFKTEMKTFFQRWPNVHPGTLWRSFVWNSRRRDFCDCRRWRTDS